MNKIIFCFVLIVLSGCGKDTAQIKLNFTMPDSNQKNTSLPTGVPVGFCNQPSIYAGVVLNQNQNSSAPINTQQILMRTNFADFAGVPPSNGLSDVLTNLTQAQIQYSSPTVLTVPRNVPVDVGILGKLYLGVKAGAEVCGDAPTHDDWNYVVAIGSTSLNAANDATVSVPVVISRKVLATAFTAADEGGSVNLVTPAARKDIIALFFQMPASPLLLNYNSAYVAIAPDGNLASSKRIIFPLKPTIAAAMTNNGPIIPGMNLPASGATAAFAVPHVFPIEVVVENTVTNPGLKCSKVFQNSSSIIRYWHTSIHSGDQEFQTLQIAQTDWTCVAI